MKILLFAGNADAGKIALDVGGEHRHAGVREAFRQNLQRYRLTGAGRAGDEPVAIREREIEVFGFDALADENLAFLEHGEKSSLPSGGALVNATRSGADLGSLCTRSGDLPTIGGAQPGNI